MRALLLACLLMGSSFLCAQSATHVVISQVYGGGGNSGAQYRNDFVELYNPTGVAVNLAGWSLQYAAGDGGFAAGAKVNLSGSIDPGRYFLLRLAAGGNVGMPLPAADEIGDINMAAGSGKVALLNTTTLLPAGCAKSGSGIVDFVGYGSANCFEGADGTPVLSNTTAAMRKENGCQDLNDNKTDFLELAPAPRNSKTIVHSCANRMLVTGVTPAPWCVDATAGANVVVNYSISGNLPAAVQLWLSDATGSFAAPLLLATLNNPAATGSIAVAIPANTAGSVLYRLRLNAATDIGEASAAVEVINGAKNISGLNAFPDQQEAAVQWVQPSGCFDELMVVAKEGSGPAGIPTGDGNNYVADAHLGGSGSAFGGGQVVFRSAGNRVVVTGLLTGRTYYFKVFTRRGANWSAGVETSVVARLIPAPGEVLINAFSTRYYNATGEYIELVNTTGKTFELEDVQLLYQDDRGDQSAVPTGMAGRLQPHSFWLLARTDTVAVRVGKTNGVPKDGISGANRADNGYIGLVRKKDNGVVDAVGYGVVKGGSFIEGQPAAAIPEGTGGGLRRKVDGADNNNNQDDFMPVLLADIDLRNSSSRLANTGAVIPAGAYSRMYVTGNSSAGGAINLAEKLVLSAGRFSLGAYALQTPLTEGGQAGGYVQTNGTGSLILAQVGSNGVTVPVGSSTYNPLVVANGSNLNWQVRVQDGVQAIGAERAVLRTWHLQPSAQPPAGANLTFSFNEGDAAQLGSSFTAQDGMQVWHFHANAWTKAGGVVFPSGLPGGFRSVQLNGWQQFSPFVLTSAAALLPVHFSDLRLAGLDGGVRLSFTANNESDIDHYDVQWAPDALRFQSLQQLAPLLNNGATARYAYADYRKPAVGGYYRVVAKERRGSLLYSPVVYWRGAALPAGLQVYTQPAGGIQYALGGLQRGNYLLQVYSAAGSRLWQGPVLHTGGDLVGTVQLPGRFKGWGVLVLTGAGGRWVRSFVCL